MFEDAPEDTITSSADKTTSHTHTNSPSLFTPSRNPSIHEILTILRENPPNTITLIAIGPLTTYAHAAALDPFTFLRAKQLLVMGGALGVPGNITPVAEFNCIADPIAAARVYALTSPNPASTMPPSPEFSSALLGAADSTTSTTTLLADYPSPATLGKERLNLVLFPLDITTPHTLTRSTLIAITMMRIKDGSPLAEWTAAFLDDLFARYASQWEGLGGPDTDISLHDLLPIWYALEGSKSLSSSSSSSSDNGWKFDREMDIRVETQGQWARGMHIVDKREMHSMREKARHKLEDPAMEGGIDTLKEVSGDSGGWINQRRGNRISVCVETPGPGPNKLAPLAMQTIFTRR